MGTFFSHSRNVSLIMNSTPTVLSTVDWMVLLVSEEKPWHFCIKRWFQQATKPKATVSFLQGRRYSCTCQLNRKQERSPLCLLKKSQKRKWEQSHTPGCTDEIIYLQNTHANQQRRLSLGPRLNTLLLHLSEACNSEELNQRQYVL